MLGSAGGLAVGPKDGRAGFGVTVWTGLLSGQAAPGSVVLLASGYSSAHSM